MEKEVEIPSSLITHPKLKPLMNLLHWGLIPNLPKCYKINDWTFNIGMLQCLDLREYLGKWLVNKMSNEYFTTPF